MKQYLKFAAILVIVIAVTSCDKKKRVYKQDLATGNTSEIMVVVQNEEQWTGPIGDSIRSFFLEDQYGLPQPEPHNVLKRIYEAGFSDLLMKHKAILQVEINPNLEEAVAKTSENFRSAPQRYIKISAPDEASWLELFGQQKDLYRIWFDQVERDRMIERLNSSVDPKISDTIAKRMGFRLAVPKGYYIAIDKPDFMWIRQELTRSSSNIVIYQTPYVDTAQFAPERLLETRNLVMQHYIPGPSEGSYMGTETNVVPPLVTQAHNFPAGYAKEMRGMWKVEHDFMGGPFVSYTFADSRTGNLVTVEGYYYEPNQKKRNKLLLLESILYSLEFVDK